MIKCLLVLSIIFISACSPQKDETKPATWLLKTLSTRNRQYRSGMINGLEHCQRMMIRDGKKPYRRLDSLIELDSTIEKEFREWSELVLQTDSESDLLELKAKALKMGQRFNPAISMSSLDFVNSQTGKALKYYVLCFGLEIEYELTSEIGSSVCCNYNRDEGISLARILRNGDEKYYSSLDSITRSGNNQKK